MREELVTFETAKLAKEKGFIHMKANCYGDNMCYQLPEGELINAIKGNIITGYILAPTQSLLQKWLREEHNIHITIFSSSQVSWMFRITKPHQKLEEGLYGEDFNTYEEALEAALQEALKLL